MSIQTISLHVPLSWPFTSPVVPSRFMPSGRAYNPDSSGLVAALPNDVPALLGFGFYVTGASAGPLTALSDVDVSVNLADNDVLTWSETDGRWENKVNAAGGGITQLTSDVTAGPGTGSQAATVAAKAITYAKIQDVASAKLLGNPTGSAGAPSEISLGVGLTFSGSTLDAVASVPVALTDAATIVIDASLGNNFTVTLGGSRTLANPTNLKAGQSLNIWITQDGSGNHTLTYGSQYQASGGSATLVLSTAAGAKDLLTCLSDTAASLTCSVLNGVAH